MRRTIGLCKHTTGKLLVMVIVLLSFTTASAQDNYLDMLDAYSKEVDSFDQVQKRGIFEDQLRRNFKGSYVLYSKLSEASKNMVFKTYRKTGRVADVRSLIVKLYAER